MVQRNDVGDNCFLDKEQEMMSGCDDPGVEKMEQFVAKYRNKMLGEMIPRTVSIVVLIVEIAVVVAVVVVVIIVLFSFQP